MRFYNTLLLATSVTAGGATYDSGLPAVSTGPGLTAILQVLFGVIGGIAVLVIVIMSLRFATAQGNPQNIAKARSGIIFAAVGLIIALSAEAIVTFVLGKI